MDNLSSYSLGVFRSYDDIFGSREAVKVDLVCGKHFAHVCRNFHLKGEAFYDYSSLKPLGAVYTSKVVEFQKPGLSLMRCRFTEGSKQHAFSHLEVHPMGQVLHYARRYIR